MPNFTAVLVSGTHIPSSRRTLPSLHRGVEAGTPRHLVQRSKHLPLPGATLGVRFSYLNLTVSLQLICFLSVMNKTSKKKLSALKITITTTLRESLGM
jgi:hypothetical protein